MDAPPPQVPPPPRPDSLSAEGGPRPLPGRERRLADLLALGESSLRSLSDGVRHIQDILNNTPAPGASDSAAVEARRTRLNRAVTGLKTGIFQMRNLLRETGRTGDISPQNLSAAQKCKRRATGAKDAAKEAITTALERSETYVRKHPGRGLLACLTVGLLLGVLLGR